MATATAPPGAPPKSGSSQDEAILAIGGLGLIGGIVWLLSRKKPVTTATCPTGYTLNSSGACVPRSKIPPPGFPADWCNFAVGAKFGAVIYHRLLGAWPAEASSAAAMKQAWSVILNREPGSTDPVTIQGWADYEAANGPLQTALNMTDSPEFALDITTTVTNATCTG